VVGVARVREKTINELSSFLRGTLREVSADFIRRRKDSHRIEVKATKEGQFIELLGHLNFDCGILPRGTFLDPLFQGSLLFPGQAFASGRHAEILVAGGHPSEEIAFTGLVGNEGGPGVASGEDCGAGIEA
tara:strand:+ start:171 stop:563 length:393 start_codon:yes stop_codon:yes gene_type:complete